MKSLILMCLLAACAMAQVTPYPWNATPCPTAGGSNCTPQTDPSGNLNVTGNLSVGGTLSGLQVLLGPRTIGSGANQLPAAASGNRDWITRITDGASAPDCTVGGGSTHVTCQSNGSAWAQFGGSGGGSGTVTVVGSGSLTNTALVTGGGTTTLQTPKTTATMDSNGNISTPGSVTAGSFTTSSSAFSAAGGEQSLASACPGSQANDTQFYNSTGHLLQVCLGSGTTVAATTVLPISATTHKWVTNIDSTGTQNLTQPAFTDISGQATTAQMPTAIDTQTVVFNDIAPASSDDGIITVLNPATAVHLTRFSCGVTGTTSVVTNLVSGGNSLIADMTATAGTVNQVIVTTWANGSSQCGGTSSCAVAAHTPVTWHIGAISGTPTNLACALDYTID